jgi:hypothetical protein
VALWARLLVAFRLLEWLERRKRCIFDVLLGGRVVSGSCVVVDVWKDRAGNIKLYLRFGLSQIVVTSYLPSFLSLSLSLFLHAQRAIQECGLSRLITGHIGGASLPNRTLRLVGVGSHVWHATGT